MRKIKILFIILTLLISAFFSGCRYPAFEHFRSDNSIMSISDMKLNKLMKFRNSYIGDNSMVSKILYSLPGNIYINQISLQTLSSPYKIKVYYGLQSSPKSCDDDIENYWSGRSYKSVLLNNAASLFILVKNVDTVNFEVDTKSKKSFNFTRKSLESFFGRNLDEYSKDKSLWNREIINGRLKKIKSVNKFVDESRVNY